MTTAWLIWREDDSREDAVTVKAVYASEAVEIWAAEVDSSSGEYAIAKGDEETVFCARDKEGSVSKKFLVSGEAVPSYYAGEVYK